MKSQLLSVFALVGLCSCGSAPAPQQEIVFGELPAIATCDSGAVIIHTDRIDGEIDLTDPQQCRFSFLELSSKGRNYIAGITQLRVHDDRYYILDWKAEKLFIYDRQGNCLKKIDDRGRGPREYTGLLTFAIDSGWLWVQDRMMPQMLIYDLDGRFVKKIPRPINITDWTRFNGLMLSYYDPQQNRHTDLGSTTLCVGTEHEVLRAGFQQIPLQKNPVGFKMFQRSWDPDEVLYLPPFSDSVYRFVDDSTCAVKYVIDHPHSIWKQQDRALSFSEYMNGMQEGKFTKLNALFDGKDQLMFEITEQGRVESYLYDKRHDRLYRIKDDYYISGEPLAVEGNRFIHTLGPDNWNYIKSRHQSGARTISNPELLQQVMKGDDDDNPALVFFEFNLPDE